MLGKLYSNAVSVEWFLQEGCFEAHFYRNDTEEVALFKSNGAFVRHFEKTKANLIPKKVFKKISQNFIGYSIDNIFFDKFHNNPSYSIHFKKNNRVTEAKFDDLGNRLKER